MLDSAEVRLLTNLIRDSFRIRENQTPIYVDIGENLTRFCSAQQLVLYGRRGSGKSCLLVHFLRTNDKNKDHIALYLGIDEIKRLGFPDILIRILLSIFKSLPGARSIFFWRKTPLRALIAELRKLLDQPETADTSTRDTFERGVSADVSGKSLVEGKISANAKTGSEKTQKFVSKKLDHLERHLQDYKEVLRNVLQVSRTRAYLLVDDYYLINRQIQPDVFDYLHRLVRGTDAYLKVATVRHRTTLRRHEEQTVGVEAFQDVEELSLDKTFEDFESTHEYLHTMLQRLADDCSSTLEVSSIFNADAGRALTLASGGVPRDFLNIFVDAIALSVRARKIDRLTPTSVYKAAAALSYKTKLASLKEDAGYDAFALEALFQDIVLFCLKEKKKTAFLVSHDDAADNPVQHELLQQLMDFKLVHLIEQNTSAASGRMGRFAAYTLDFSIFMEPRRRGIEIVEFWNTDDQRRPLGLREAPDYPLTRIGTKPSASSARLSVEELIESIEVDDKPHQG